MNALLHYRTELDYADAPPGVLAELAGERLRGESMNVTVEDLAKDFGTTAAVNGVSLKIAGGELIALLGPSGSGKTTLLRLIAGFEHPDTGSISLSGSKVAGENAWVPAHKRHVGYVAQDGALFPHLTKLANVMFGLKALPKVEAEREARLALDRVGLADLADAYPHTLSGGEQQRIALARAVAPRPSRLSCRAWSTFVAVMPFSPVS